MNRCSANPPTNERIAIQASVHRSQATGHWWRVPRAANAEEVISNRAESSSSFDVKLTPERSGHIERHPLAIAALQVCAPVGHRSIAGVCTHVTIR